MESYRKDARILYRNGQESVHQSLRGKQKIELAGAICVVSKEVKGHVSKNQHQKKTYTK